MDVIFHLVERLNKNYFLSLCKREQNIDMVFESGSELFNIRLVSAEFNHVHWATFLKMSFSQSLPQEDRDSPPPVQSSSNNMRISTAPHNK